MNGAESLVRTLVDSGVDLCLTSPGTSDAAYASLVRDERRKLHLAVAETMEKDTAGPTTTEPELLAKHFADAGAPDKAIDYYLKAAGRTTGRFAFAEMVSQLNKGLRQLVHLPKSLETQQRELALQVALGRALIDHRGSGSEEVREAFERAHELWRDRIWSDA